MSGRPLNTKRLPIIVDTDVGGDDVMALAFLLSQPGVDIEAITICNGLAHVGQGASNVLRVLESSGRKNIPVYVGRSRPLRGKAAFPDAWRKTSDTILGVDVSPPRLFARRESAAEYLLDRLSDRRRKVRFLALGPLTNIGEVLQRAPECSRGIQEIVISGGAVHVPGNLGDGGYFKTDNTTAEWNMFVDPFAASMVFESGMNITLVPLDATNKVQIDQTYLNAFEQAARTPFSIIVRNVLEANREYIEQGLYYAWDPLVATIMTTPRIATMKPMAIKIGQLPPNEGQTEPAKGRKSNVRVALHPRVDVFRKTFFSAFGLP